MLRVPFAKMHGAGNDFVVVDRRAATEFTAATTDPASLTAFVRAVCDRRQGVGADGVLFLDAAGADPEDAGLAFRMRYHNRDGGRADLCGNGGRCLAAFAAARGLADAGRLDFASDAGRHAARVIGDRVELVLGDVAAPRHDVSLEVPGGPVRAGHVVVGVPHLVIEVADVSGLDLAAFAPPLRAHSSLGAAGANVDVATVIGADRVRLRTFERGVEGETLACGTGAAATAIVLVAAGRIRPPVTLEVASGDLLGVSFEHAGETFRAVTLAGPVATSFEGDYFWQPPGPPSPRDS